MTVIGILPAAGNATRLHGLPKYLLPIPGGYLLKRHIEAMDCNGITKTFIVTTEGRAGLLKQYRPTGSSEVIIADEYETMTQTVLTVWGRVSKWRLSDEVKILFGMPDTYFTSNDVYPRLLFSLDSGADVAVGVFHTRFEQRGKLGMCRVQSGRVTEVIDKPECTNLHWAWGVLAWRPVFWDYLRPEMPHVGYGLPCAIESGLDVRAVEMDGQYFDCGTPEEYFQCIRTITAEKELA